MVKLLPYTTFILKYNNFLIFQSQTFSSLTIDGKKKIKIDHIKVISETNYHNNMQPFLFKTNYFLKILLIKDEIF